MPLKITLRISTSEDAQGLEQELNVLSFLFSVCICSRCGAKAEGLVPKEVGEDGLVRSVELLCHQHLAHRFQAQA